MTVEHQGAHTIRDQLFEQIKEMKQPLKHAIQDFLARLKHPQVQDHFAMISDQALDEAYGYGLSPKGSFGHEANSQTARAVIKKLLEFGEKCLETGEQQIEKLAAAAHEGWSIAAKSVNDPAYVEKPEKRENRLKLANSRYEDLTEDEKAKDRVAAQAILKDIKENGGLEKWLSKPIEA